jgi:NAD(P)-dependent dehydrogenase (short-subunit alcohol dehydrogenase family)
VAEIPNIQRITRVRVDGKVAVVTGSTRGVGAATVRRLAEEGARVVVTGRAADLGAAVVADILAAGGQAVFVAADLKSEDDVRRIIQTAIDNFGALHILVNNGAPTEMLFNGKEKSVFEQTTEDYDDIVKVGQYSVFWATKYAIPHMREAGGGAIINISSIAGSLGGEGLHAYSVTKGALDAFTRQVAADTAKLGIRCNTVMLGAVNNGGFARQLAEHPAYAEANANLNMLGRWGLPREVANLVVFLASDEASFITAAHIPCDGGQLNRMAVPRFTDITIQ